jgi:hypothetical protein
MTHWKRLKEVTMAWYHYPIPAERLVARQRANSRGLSDLQKETFYHGNLNVQVEQADILNTVIRSGELRNDSESHFTVNSKDHENSTTRFTVPCAPLV